MYLVTKYNNNFDLNVMDKRLTLEEIQNKIDTCGVDRDSGYWRHNKTGNWYFIVTISFHVTARTVQVTYVPDKTGYPLFTRDIEDFKAKFTKH